MPRQTSDHEVCTAVPAVLLPAGFGALRCRAMNAHTAVAGESRSVAFVRRFGGSVETRGRKTPLTRLSWRIARLFRIVKFLSSSRVAIATLEPVEQNDRGLADTRGPGRDRGEGWRDGIQVLGVRSWGASQDADEGGDSTFLGGNESSPTSLQELRPGRSPSQHVTNHPS